MTPPGGPLATVRAAAKRLTGMIRTTTGPSATLGAVTESIRPLTEGMRSLARQRAAAEQTATALAALPERARRELTDVTVRCLGNELLLRVVRIPAHLPGAAYDTHLVLPTSAATYQYGEQRVTARAGFLVELDSIDVRCRCHPGVPLTAAQLRGESPPPVGIRIHGVVQS